MKIGIIGTGAIGGTIARKLASAGHDVKVANSKGVEGVAQFANDISATPTDLYGAVEDVEVVVLSIPFAAIATLPKDLFDAVPNDVVVVDTANYYPGVNHGAIDELEEGMVESLWTAKQIGRPVVKAFNMVLAHSLAHAGKAAGSKERLALLVAGDKAADKAKVMRLADDMGFDGVDNGALAESWSQQPNSPGYCCDYTADELRAVRRKSGATQESVFQNHKRFDAEFAALAGGDFSHENVIRLNREMNK